MPTPTRLVLLGHPVAHSKSPIFQNAALRAAHIDIRYEAVDVDPPDLETVLARLKEQGAAGNVTVPFKERVHDACDVLSALARRVGAVNTFWVDDSGQLAGDNTDVGGFDRAVRTLLELEPRGLSVGVLGAGGAAAAVLAAVETWKDCYAHVYNRTPERAANLAARFGAVAQPVDDMGVIAGADLVVNATSVGLRDDTLPIDVDMLRKDSAVVDLVYRTGGTALVRGARERGHRAIDGTIMLFEQGALAFERWLGRAPDREVMWRALTGSPARS